MENQIDLKENIIEIGRRTNFRPDLIEKDYHLTKILHKLSEKKIHNLVFKGGTCLNKCYLGFYRLSEDLDFVYNQDVKGLSKGEVKKKLDELRRIIFEILENLGIETSKELGVGWKMLTSKEKPNIVGLEIIASYKSVISELSQKIKIEISFRKKLINETKMRPIHHEFIDSLGKPILEEDIKIEAIDIVENFAEKFRALITRKNIAIRDVFDIYFILKEKKLKFDKEILKLALLKINESKPFEEKEFFSFIENLSSKADNLDKKEISTVLKKDQEINVSEMIDLIKKEVLSLK